MEDEIDRLLELYPDGASPTWLAPTSPLNVVIDPAQGSPYGTGKANQLTPQWKRLSSIQGDLVFQCPRRMFLKSLSPRQDTWSYCKLPHVISVTVWLISKTPPSKQAARWIPRSWNSTFSTRSLIPGNKNSENCVLSRHTAATSRTFSEVGSWWTTSYASSIRSTQTVLQAPVLKSNGQGTTRNDHDC